jgi:hypothetical protein
VQKYICRVQKWQGEPDALYASGRGGCAAIFAHPEGAYLASMTIDVCKILINGVYFVCERFILPKNQGR